MSLASPVISAQVAGLPDGPLSEPVQMSFALEPHGRKVRRGEIRFVVVSRNSVTVD